MPQWVYRPAAGVAVYETEYASGSVETVEPDGWRPEVWCLKSMNQLECAVFPTLAAAKEAVERWVDEVTPPAERGHG